MKIYSDKSFMSRSKFENQLVELGFKSTIKDDLYFENSILRIICYYKDDRIFTQFRIKMDTYPELCCIKDVSVFDVTDIRDHLKSVQEELMIFFNERISVIKESIAQFEKITLNK